MGQKKETYWSQFTNEYEEKQAFVTGQELIAATHSELLKEKKLGKVLELGCGTGLYTETLIKNSDSILATDFSDEMIEMAKKKRGNLKNVKFQKADALDLEFEIENFDTVFMANLIHIIGNAEKLIQESSKVLKKGGSIIITSFAIDEMSFFNRISMGYRYIKTFGKPSNEATSEKTSRKYVASLLLNNGFDLVKNIVLGKKSKSIFLVGKKV
jgi:ABC-2 type transport system ATP-binding protein